MAPGRLQAGTLTAPATRLRGLSPQPAAPIQQEEVWKREQAKLQEDKRLEELKKQIGEEREAQDLLRVAQEAGHVMCVRSSLS
jgi:hypothetical protein